VAMGRREAPLAAAVPLALAPLATALERVGASRSNTPWRRAAFGTWLGLGLG